MATWRATAYWKSILSKYEKSGGISTPTHIKIQPYSSSSHKRGEGAALGSLRLLKPDFVPIYTLFGMTLLGIFLGTLTIKQQLMHAPNVVVDKKKRKTVPEVKDPEFTLKKSEDFVNKSFFRRVGQNTKRDSDLAKAMPWITNRNTSDKSMDTLKSAGVEES